MSTPTPLDPQPLRLLCVGDLPGPAFSAFTAVSDAGRLLCESAATREQAGMCLTVGPAPHAMLLMLAPHETPEVLTAWPGFAQAVSLCAVVVVAHRLRLEQAAALVRTGVQDVIDASRADAAEIERVVVLATQRWRQEQEIRRAWSIDLDTGLPNRAQLMEMLQQLCALREREPVSMALVVFRLEGLAALERQVGRMGSQVMRRKAAVRLRAALRASDVVAALAADVFAVVLTHLDAPSHAGMVAAKLARALREPYQLSAQHVQVAVATGFAVYPGDSKDAETLLKLAFGAAAHDVATSLQRGDAANDG